MALSQGIFSSDWVYHHRPAAKSAMQARVRIERIISEGTFNAVTGLIDGGSTQVLYLGKARLDKAARPRRTNFEFDSAENQVVNVQIPLELAENEASPSVAPNWQDNDIVTVLANTSNSQLVGDKYYIHADAGSSNDWVQSLVCRYSSKQGS
jgi:hypothetical protein